MMKPYLVAVILGLALLIGCSNPSEKGLSTIAEFHNDWWAIAGSPTLSERTEMLERLDNVELKLADSEQEAWDDYVFALRQEYWARQLWIQWSDYLGDDGLLCRAVSRENSVWDTLDSFADLLDDIDNQGVKEMTISLCTLIDMAISNSEDERWNAEFGWLRSALDRVG